jgi:hypothetical protein
MSARLQPVIVPKRGCYVRPGDVIKPTPETRRRVLWRYQVAPLRIVGEWDADGQPELFELCPISWYTVERNQVDLLKGDDA